MPCYLDMNSVRLIYWLSECYKCRWLGCLQVYLPSCDNQFARHAPQ